MEGYEVTIKDCTKNLTARERIMLKDTSDAHKLDEVAPIAIEPDYYAELQIHNEKSDNKDYNVLVIVDKNGEKYVTGSPSFASQFKDIFTDIAGEDEPWGLKVYKMDSKNYKGKQFLTCSIV